MKKSLYKKSLLMYSLILGCLAIIFLIYIIITLKSYEDAQLDNLLLNSVQSISEKELIKILEDNNITKDMVFEYQKMINSDEVEVKEIEENKYELYLNERKMFVIETKDLGVKTKLGLFTYVERDVVSVEPCLDRGLVYYDVIIPSTWQLLVDDKVVEKGVEVSEYEDLEFMYQSEVMPKKVRYEVNNVINKTVIKVKDENGLEYNFDVEEGFIWNLGEKAFKKFEDLESILKYLGEEIDVWSYVHDWSLFLTRDLSGNRFGYYNIKEKIVENTELAQMAYNWAHNVDILFTSAHTLRNPAFTNESLSNFVAYGKNAFSCEVYTEKNMVVGGKDQKDIMHDYVYFVKENDGWKLINIKPAEGDINE
ncbi:MAG: hypothetical protein E7172_02190 [Firmicutes bacterium]|nr:hypothetical protein [Bacillota bacterium]